MKTVFPEFQVPSEIEVSRFLTVPHPSPEKVFIPAIEARDLVSPSRGNTMLQIPQTQPVSLTCNDCGFYAEGADIHELLGFLYDSHGLPDLGCPTCSPQPKEN